MFGQKGSGALLSKTISSGHVFWSNPLNCLESVHSVEMWFLGRNYAVQHAGQGLWSLDKAQNPSEMPSHRGLGMALRYLRGSHRVPDAVQVKFQKAILDNCGPGVFLRSSRGASHAGPPTRRVKS